jgi:hypothetical protein
MCASIKGVGHGHSGRVINYPSSHSKKSPFSIGPTFRTCCVPPALIKYIFFRTDRVMFLHVN